MKLIKFFNIKDFLDQNSIHYSTNLNNNTEIAGINSITNAGKNEICFDTPMIVIIFLGLGGALYLLKDSFNEDKSCDCDK